MIDPRDVRADLGDGASDEIVRLAERLQAERPVPSAGFRGALRRTLVVAGPGHVRPQRLRVLIVAWGSAGGAMLLAGALSAAGVGPLGA